MVDTHIAVEPVVGPQNTSWVHFLAVLAQYDHQNTSVVDLMVDPMVDHGRGGHFHGRPRGRVVALLKGVCFGANIQRIQALKKENLKDEQAF